MFLASVVSVVALLFLVLYRSATSIHSRRSTVVVWDPLANLFVARSLVCQPVGLAVAVL